MNEILVEKIDLLAILEENRKKHQDEYQHALEGWRAIISNEIGLCIEQLRIDKSEIESGNKNTRVKPIEFEYDPPVSHDHDYRRAIDMLNMHTDSKIALRTPEYRQYVEDDWDWRKPWTNRNSRYM